MLSSFLTQINIYIWFNIELFNTEAEKVLFTTAHLCLDTLNWFKLTLNWFELTLKNYLNNERSQWDNSINKIFISFQIFKKKIKVIFEIINKEHNTKWEISLLWQTEAAVTYTTNFQRLNMYIN